MRERLLAYLLGELAGEERAEVEAALARSPELRAEAELWRRVLETLRAEPPPPGPAYAVRRAALLRRAGRPWWLRRPALTAAAAALLLALLGVYALWRPQSGHPRRPGFAPREARGRAEVAPPLEEGGIEARLPRPTEELLGGPVRVEGEPDLETPIPSGPRFGRAVRLGRADPAWRERLLKRYGGDGRTEAAVVRGLEHLLRYQRADGGFWLSRDPVGTTGLVVQALLARGLAGPFARPARRGVQYLVRCQRPDGALALPGSEPDPLAHTLAAQALLDAAACMNLRDVPEEAVRRALVWLRPERIPGGAAAAQAVFLFTLAHRAGYPLPGPARRYLEAWCRQAGPEDLFALVSRPFFGQGEATVLVRRLPAEAADEETLLAWLSASQALLRLGDREAWAAWNRRLRSRVLSAQAEDGRFRWPGDPVRTTALGVLLLEVYYRYRGL